MGPTGATGAPGPAGPPGAAAPPPVIVGCTGCPASTSGSSQSGIILTFSDLKGLVEAAARVEEVWGEFKFALPVLIGLIPVIATIGVFYVGITSKQVRRDIESKFEDQKKDFNRQFAESEAKSNARVSASEAKMSFMGSSIIYRLALDAWSKRDFSEAIRQAAEALEYADDAIGIFESLAKRGMGEAKDLTRNLEYRCHVVGDLAYYYAESYQTRRQIDDAAGALQSARRMLEEWSVFGADPPPNLVDNYLYVLAVVKNIASDELDTGRALWRKYYQPIVDYLEQETPTMAKEHLELFKQFFGAAQAV
jgi:hypothetical protein